MCPGNSSQSLCGIPITHYTSPAMSVARVHFCHQVKGTVLVAILQSDKAGHILEEPSEPTNDLCAFIDILWQKCRLDFKEYAFLRMPFCKMLWSIADASRSLTTADPFFGGINLALWEADPTLAGAWLDDQVKIAVHKYKIMYPRGSHQRKQKPSTPKDRPSTREHVGGRMADDVSSLASWPTQTSHLNRHCQLEVLRYVDPEEGEYEPAPGANDKVQRWLNKRHAQSCQQALESAWEDEWNMIEQLRGRANPEEPPAVKDQVRLACHVTGADMLVETINKFARGYKENGGRERKL